LAIHAHPDDIETLSAGTLALLGRSGHDIAIATMTAGDCGSTDHGPVETARIRKEEAARAASLIGASYVCLDFPDLGVFNEDSSRRRVVAMLRAVQPQIVIAPSPEDYHPDHEATSALVRDACFAVSVPNYAAGDAPVLERIPFLYFMDPIEGVNREGRAIAPDFTVDVTTTMDERLRMLQCHESQRSWVVRQHGVDNYTGAVESFARARGRQAGCDFAEGFRQYRGHPYPGKPLLQNLLGGFVRPQTKI
jgi:LmbE family N-acetylglucosaminyl deacetylase